MLAIGHASGSISIFDVRLGEQLISCKMDMLSAKHALPLPDHRPHRGITAVTFRTDNLAHTLATASSDGHIALWDLDAGPDGDLPPGRLVHTIKHAHQHYIGGLSFLHGQPVLVSSSADNSLKQFLFDSPHAPPRLLRERAGHMLPVSLVRYYGTDGKSLLTASDDQSLRMTSVVRDSRSHELSQGSSASSSSAANPSLKQLVSPEAVYTSRLPRVSAMSYSSARSRDWDDLVTIHQNEAVARTWSVQNKRKGNWTLALSDPLGKVGGKSTSSAAKAKKTAFGNAKVRSTLSICTIEHSADIVRGMTGSVGFGLRQLRFHGVRQQLANWDVEFAVWHQTQDVRLPSVDFAANDRSGAAGREDGHWHRF